MLRGRSSPRRNATLGALWCPGSAQPPSTLSRTQAELERSQAQVEELQQRAAAAAQEASAWRGRHSALQHSNDSLKIHLMNARSPASCGIGEGSASPRPVHCYSPGAGAALRGSPTRQQAPAVAPPVAASSPERIVRSLAGLGLGGSPAAAGRVKAGSPSAATGFCLIDIHATLPATGSVSLSHPPAPGTSPAACGSPARIPAFFPMQQQHVQQAQQE